MRPEQTDVPIKNLLKQVYSAHTTKVKCLEDEIEGLKNKLFEAEKELRECHSNCKRCSELEEAFTTCKAALEEQTKWFESFGQKFSIFNSSENKARSKISKLQDDIVEIHNENSFASDIPQSNQTSEKSSVSKKSFLKNLLISTPEKVQDSLDLCTVPFPGNLGPSCSSLNIDSVILAPDTVDVTLDAQNNALKQSRTKPKLSKSSEQFNNVTDNPKDYSERNKGSKKRSCSNSSESEKSPNKKLNKGVEKTSPGEKKNLENKMEKKELMVEVHIESEHTENSNGKLLNEKTIDLFNLKTSKNNTPMETDNIKEKKVSVFDSEISKDSNTENSAKIPSTGKEKSSRNKLELTSNKDSMYQVSPSLLPLNKKNETALLQNQAMLAEDINDFQVPSINKNPPEIADAWKTCDKKKTKKNSNVKNIKLTSKFKMSLDALPPNYKKPNLRQTKLSKSIFQPKNSTPEDVFSNEAKKILSDSSNSSAESSKKNSPVSKRNKTSTIDFDATCIPENYKYNAESSDDEEILLIPDESSDESMHSPALSPKTKVKSITKDDASKENKEKDKFEDFLCGKKQVDNENLNSFDRLPKREEPNYKYKEETVRKKSERKQLAGFDCKECEKYFADLGLSEEEKRERLNKCSRHRAKFQPPATPEHFWELDFPDTQECKARGYLNETQKVTLKTHRRRPL